MEERRVYYNNPILNNENKINKNLNGENMNNNYQKNYPYLIFDNYNNQYNGFILNEVPWMEKVNKQYPEANNIQLNNNINLQTWNQGN